MGVLQFPRLEPQTAAFYFADTLDRAIYAYDFDRTAGSISGKRLFASTQDDPGSADGSTIDAEGFLWNAQWDGWRLVRYAPDGSVDRIVALPGFEADQLHVGDPI